MAPIEIQMSFDLASQKTQSMIERLVEKSLVRTIEVGHGMFVELIINPMACDPNTGVCAL